MSVSGDYFPENRVLQAEMAPEGLHKPLSGIQQRSLRVIGHKPASAARMPGIILRAIVPIGGKMMYNHCREKYRRTIRRRFGEVSLMWLREFEYILAIAEERSMNRAAQRLFITQPALSKMLASLEASLNTQLFERAGRAMVPTEAGRQYIQYARELIRLNQEMESSLTRRSQENRLTVGLSMLRVDMFTRSVLPGLVGLFPDASVRLHTFRQTHFLQALIDREIPIAFGVVTADLMQHLSYARVGTEEMVLVVPSGHPLIKKALQKAGFTYPFVPPEKLQDERFILSDQANFSGRFADSYFHENHIMPAAVLRTEYSSQVPGAIAAGLGIGILPSLPVRHADPDGKYRYLSIAPSGRSMTIGVLYRKDHVLSPLEEAVIRLLREVYSQPDSARNPDGEPSGTDAPAD